MPVELVKVVTTEDKSTELDLYHGGRFVDIRSVSASPKQNFTRKRAEKQP